MPQQDDEATELEHAEEVGFVVFPAAHQSTEVVKPGEEAFDFPTAAITTQFATILGIFPTAIVLMGRNESDAVFLAEALVTVSGISDTSKTWLGLTGS